MNFAATNAPGTCLWCGRKLRRECKTTWADTDKRRPPTSACLNCDGTSYEPAKDGDGHICKHCGHPSYGGRRVRRVVKREPLTATAGYGGFFDTLQCGMDFALALAKHGRRLEPRGNE